MENKARIQKVLSDQGILSRRRTEELIKEGRITVNGRPAQPGHPIDIRRDIVAIDGERVWFQKKKKNYYVMLHKPRGYVTTMSDEKGRRSPVPTGEFTEINCDTVIAAVGERVDSDLFTANGIEVNAKGIPEFRTNLENVFVGGDAMRGPATVVEGIADAQYFANAVIGSVHSVAIPDDAHATRDEAIARKGVLCPPKAGCEGERCLHCNTVCQVCADVCPNRANVVITLPDGRHEILHVDRMCNECGNCAVFCPYDSAPYRNKFTLFLTREGFDESTENQGFLPLEGRKVLVRLDGKVFEADLDGQNQLPADVETFILTVLKDYAYLL